MKDSIGARMRCPVCNKYMPDRCTCKREKPIKIVTGICGVGKSTLISSMIKDSISTPPGVMVIGTGHSSLEAEVLAQQLKEKLHGQIHIPTNKI